MSRLTFLGGTADISVLEVQSNGNLKSLAAPSGGPWGGTNVDRHFDAFILEMFGKDVMDAFSEECKPEELELHRMFECKKRYVQSDDETVYMKLPHDLYEVFEEKKQERFDVSLSRSDLSQTVSKKRDILHIDSIHFRKMFDEAKNQLLDHVEKELSSPKLKDVKNIIMVGGFSESEIMEKAVRDKFTPKGYEVIVPEGAVLAVVKGVMLCQIHCNTNLSLTFSVRHFRPPSVLQDGMSS